MMVNGSLNTRIICQFQSLVLLPCGFQNSTEFLERNFLSSEDSGLALSGVQPALSQCRKHVATWHALAFFT